MYLGSKLRALSLEGNVNVVTNIEIFIIKLGNRGVNQAPNYLLKGYMRRWAPTKAYLFST